MEVNISYRVCSPCTPEFCGSADIIFEKTNTDYTRSFILIQDFEIEKNICVK